MAYTRLEQYFMERLPDTALLDHKMLANINGQLKLTTPKTLNKIISGLCRKGALLRLKRGIYLVVKGGQPDPLLIGCMALEGYVSFDTALFFYGYRHAYSSTVYCATSRNIKVRVSITDITYVGVPLGGLAFGYVYDKGRRIATKAKLVFDIIFTKFRYVEEIFPVLDLIRDLNEESASEFLTYIGLSGDTAMLERTGFLFSVAGGNRKVMEYIMKKIKKDVIVRLDPGIGTFGSYNKEWHVYDNINARASATENR